MEPSSPNSAALIEGGSNVTREVSIGQDKQPLPISLSRIVQELHGGDVHILELLMS
jgi:hypothetical protein